MAQELPNFDKEVWVYVINKSKPFAK
jgi:hypothetical protein